MYSRIQVFSQDRSTFLFGPRGTGKSYWVQTAFPDSAYLDLLDSAVSMPLAADPRRLGDFIPDEARSRPVVIDEVQKVPTLLDEVHRLIEGEGLRFVLTGSSARKLRSKGVNLLAGRAVTRTMHPLTAHETGDDFVLDQVIRFGCLPAVFNHPEPQDFLASYVATYLKEEVLQEGLTRNLAAFTRFLEAASFSQGSVLNVSGVARECHVHRKVVEEYFTILEDLLIGIRLPVFTRKARRKIIVHPKFYLFDVGVFRAIRPAGPLDSLAEIEGAALETLLLQQLRALNDGLRLGYDLSYWRTRDGLEVDFVLYGERGLIALEVKRTRTVRGRDLRGLRAFKLDYPMARVILLYGGDRPMRDGGVELMPVEEGLRDLANVLETGAPRVEGLT